MAQRCSRWLLMTHDRVGREEFLLTHEFLAAMLGLRRASVSAVAATLQHAGLIRIIGARSPWSTARGWKRPPASVIGLSPRSTTACSGPRLLERPLCRRDPEEGWLVPPLEDPETRGLVRQALP